MSLQSVVCPLPSGSLSTDDGGESSRGESKLWKQSYVKSVKMLEFISLLDVFLSKVKAYHDRITEMY